MHPLESLTTATLAEVAQRIARREISPVELTDAMLARIARLDGRLHSYITVMPEHARAQARAAEQEIASGTYRGRLHGVPIALKDLVNTCDAPTTCASPLLRDFRPSYDAAVVERLDAAGAVTLGKLNLTEFALYGYHPSHTPPNNPWKLDHWAGVSSSGSGAATAASLCYASLGTDTGGSIRFPSAACGVVGIKPTFGKVSRYGVFPLADTLDHIGPMARCVADAAYVLQVLEGRDPRDAATRTDPPGDYAKALVQGARGLRVGLDRAYSTADTDPRMSAALFSAVEVLVAQGAEVVELNSPELADAAQHWLAVCAVDALIAHKDFYPAQAASYGPAFRRLLDHGAQVSAAEYARATRQRQATRALLDELLAGIDVLVCPAAPAPAGRQADFGPQDVMPDEAIAPLVRYSAPTNFSGHPSITLPNGFTDDGLPLAMQFIGRHGDEAAIIRAAAAYEAATEWHTRRPPL
ncbi:MAG: amidase [Gammaproteobacteria bacterium]